MKNKHKIRAYTLSEVLVVLVITTVVMGIALTVLQLVQKQMHVVKSSFKYNTEVNNLENILWLDFNSYQNINLDNNNRTLTLKSEIDSIVYIFKNEIVLRKQDTFNLNITNINTLFKTKKNLIKVDAIELSVEKNNLKSELFIYKQNDAKSILE